MKVSYTLIKLTSKELLVRSTNYYTGPGLATREETVNSLEIVESFDNESDAVSHLINIKETMKEDSDSRKYLSGDYIILPVYTV